MKKILMTIGVLVLMLAGLSACAGGDINDAAQAFMTALSIKDYAAAFDLSGPQLQAQVGGAEGLEAALPGTLSDWKFDSISQENNTGTMEKLKTPKRGYWNGRLEYILKITRAKISMNTIPAALVNLSSKISRKIFKGALR